MDLGDVSVKKFGKGDFLIKVEQKGDSNKLIQIKKKTIRQFKF